MIYMSEETLKTYTVEGRNTDILKPTDIIASDREMAIEIYKQLYSEQIIGIEEMLFEARVMEEKDMIKN